MVTRKRPAMISKHWLVTFCLIPSLVVIVLAGLGFVAGRYSVTRHFTREIGRAARAYYLGNLLSGKEKKEIAPVYKERDKVLKRIDEISWSVPNMPTPFVGSAPVPGRQGTASINSMQFRAEKEVEMSKPEDTYRIFITGGSTAYGSGAPAQDRTIAGYLNHILDTRIAPLTGKKYEVFTVADPAWASTHERIVIENRLSELEPDLILSFSGNNDVHWARLGRNILWFRTYADEFFLSLIQSVYKFTGQPDMPEVIRIEGEEIPPALVAERLLKNTKLSSLALVPADAGYLFVLQPTLAVTRKKLTEREQESLKHQDYFRKCYAGIDKALSGFHAVNFEYVNLSDVFDDLSDDEDIFLDSFHFGDKGNEIIAEKIFLHIKNRFSP